MTKAPCGKFDNLSRFGNLGSGNQSLRLRRCFRGDKHGGGGREGGTKVVAEERKRNWGTLR